MFRKRSSSKKTQLAWFSCIKDKSRAENIFKPYLAGNDISIKIEDSRMSIEKMKIKMRIKKKASFASQESATDLDTP